MTRIVNVSPSTIRHDFADLDWQTDQSGDRREQRRGNGPILADGLTCNQMIVEDRMITRNSDGDKLGGFKGFEVP